MKEEEDAQMLDCGNLCAKVDGARDEKYQQKATFKSWAPALQVSHMEALLHRPSSTE
jgi:hypothetical protein